MIMGNRVGTLSLLIVSGVALAAAAGDAQPNLLYWPESVVFDAPRDRYIISNWGSGDLVAMDAAGEQSILNDELGQAAGLHIEGNIIYTAASEGEITGIVGFDLDSGERVVTVPIPELELINDVTSDGAGHIYVTDCDANKIYKVTLATQSYTTFVAEGLGYPNGILFDGANHRLLVVNGLLPDGPLLAVNLADSSLSPVALTHLTGLDGLTVDNDGHTYFSSWTTDCVYRWEPGFGGDPELVSSAHQNPADIGFNLRDQVLAVPNFYQNRVDFLPIAQQGIGDERHLPEQGRLECAPNPFTTSTRIRLAAAEVQSAQEVVSIHDNLGRCIRTLANPGGQGTLVWDGEDARGRAVAAGTYFVRLHTGGAQWNRRIIRID